MEVNNIEKINDFKIKIGNTNYFLEIYDTNKIASVQHRRGNNGEVYVSKISAYEETKDFKEEDKYRNLNYICFEIPSKQVRETKENSEVQNKFMEYVALYYLYSKKDDRENSEYYIGQIIKAEDGHYIPTKSEAVKKIFREYMEKLRKTNSDDTERK